MISSVLCEIPTLKKRDAIYLLVLALTVIAFHPLIFFSQHIPLDEDSLLFFYPLRSLHSDAYTGFWDSYMFCGFPRDANPQAQLLYSPNIIFHILPTSVGFSLLLTGHIFLGAALMYLLLRGLKLSPEAALFGALAFMLSTFWRCKITNLGLLEGISWVPGVLYFYLLSLETGKWPSRMAAALFLGMVILAGVPHTVLYTLVFLFLITLSGMLLRERPPIQTIWIFLSVILSSAILTIGMWLPALNYLPNSGRNPLELNNALEGSIQWLDIWKVFLGGLSQPDISRCDPWEGTCYIGATALFFLPTGFMTVPRRLRIALSLSILFAVLCTLGKDGWIFPILFNYFPGWNTVNLPNRALLIAAAALPVFSAFGLQSWLDRKCFTRMCRISLPLLSLVLILTVMIACIVNPAIWHVLKNSALTKTFQPDSISDGVWAILWLALWIGITSLVTYLLTCPGVKRTYSFVLLLILLGAQSAYYSPRLFLQTVSPDYFNAPRTVRTVIKDSNNSGYRTCSFLPMIDTGSDVRMSLLQPAIMHRLPEIYRLHEIQGYDPLFPKQYGELIRAWAGHSRATDKTRTIRLDRFSKSLMDFLSVKSIIGYPDQETLYTGKPVEIDTPESLVSPLKQPKKVQSVFFRWLMAGADRIPQGALIGNIAVMNASTTVQRFPIRMGIEIANYILDHPQAPVQHNPAREFRWFPIPSRYGYLSIHQYMAVYTLQTPSLADRISIEFLSPIGRLAIMEIDLLAPSSHGLIDSHIAAEVPVYTNPDAFSPVYLTRRVLRYQRLDEMVDAFQNLKENDEIPVFFPAGEDVAFESSPVPTPQQESGLVTYERPDSDRFIIQTRSKFDGMLVITETYSSNWSAKIDGKQIPILRANHAFMAVPITAGEHTITLTYLPRLFFFAISIGGAMLAFVLLLLFMYPQNWLYPNKVAKPFNPDRLSARSNIPDIPDKESSSL